MPPAPSSKPIPATIGLLFGGLWAFLAAMALPPGWRLPTALLAGVTTIVLITRLWRQRAPQQQDGRLFGTASYRVAVVLEILAIYAASALLSHLGLQSYFIQAVGIIVGLHFIGLWHATGAVRFLRIAAGMCVFSALAMLLPETSGLLHLRDAVTGLANALILWFGAGAMAHPRQSDPTAR